MILRRFSKKARLWTRHLALTKPQLHISHFVPTHLRWIRRSIWLGILCFFVGIAFFYGTKSTQKNKAEQEKINQLEQKIERLMVQNQKLLDTETEKSAQASLEKNVHVGLMAKVQELESENQKLKEEIRFIKKVGGQSVAGTNLRIMSKKGGK
jgi:hypothetical protein